MTRPTHLRPVGDPPAGPTPEFREQAHTALDSLLNKGAIVLMIVAELPNEITQVSVPQSVSVERGLHAAMLMSMATDGDE